MFIILSQFYVPTFFAFFSPYILSITDPRVLMRRTNDNKQCGCLLGKALLLAKGKGI